MGFQLGSRSSQGNIIEKCLVMIKRISSNSLLINTRSDLIESIKRQNRFESKQSQMSRDSLFSIINHWKNEAYHLSHQLELLKNDYQQKHISFQSPTMNINEDLFNEVFINRNELRTNSSTNQISLLYHLFLNHLKKLLIKQIFEEESTRRRKTFPIMNLIETNIEQISSLINQMNEDYLKTN